jgi:hypothetical protein
MKYEHILKNRKQAISGIWKRTGTQAIGPKGLTDLKLEVESHIKV